MTASTSPPRDAQLTVAIAEPAAGRWQLRLRPAGPAGLLEARLPGDITIHTDRAQPDVPLELVVRSDSSTPDEAVLDLAATLFGPASRAVLQVPAAPAMVPYSPDETRVRQGLLALVSLVGGLDQRPALAAVDVASAAASLAAQAPPALARLLTTAATTYAAAAAAALRVLPARDQLGLDADGRALLDDLVALVSGLLGADVAFGRVAQAEPAVIGTAWPYDQLADLLAREHSRLDVAVARGAARRRADGAIPVESGSVDDRLPIHVEAVVIVSDGREQHTVRGTAFLLVGEGGVLQVMREVDVAADEWPPLWVRAVSSHDSGVLYQARAAFTGSTFEAELSVWGEYLTDFTLEVTSDPTRRPIDARARAGERATAIGAAAMQGQHSATSAADWAQIAERWRECGALWRVAGDPARRALALVHAMRAFVAAGARYADQLRLTRASAAAALARLDPGWLAPRPDEAATADPLALRPLLISAALTPRLTQWAITELGRLPEGSGRSSDDISADVLAWMLSRTAHSGDPGDPRLQEARARARVRVALLAARAGRLDIAQAVLLPTAIEYPLLDASGRAQFADVSRILLAEPDV